MKQSTGKKSTKKNFVTKDTYELQFGIKWATGVNKVKYGKALRHDASKNGKKLY
jgi:hypothetical protein